VSGVVVGVLLAVIVAAVVLIGVRIVLAETNTHHVQMAVENRKTTLGVLDRQLAAQQIAAGQEPAEPEPDRPRVRIAEPGWLRAQRLDRAEPRALPPVDRAELPPGITMPGERGTDVPRHVREAGW
jgi:hypothetical protein